MKYPLIHRFLEEFASSLFSCSIMCRSCKSDAPKWGHGIKVPVSDLPRFFESQQSWNFEQKIYGRNVEVLVSLLNCEFCNSVTLYLWEEC